MKLVLITFLLIATNFRSFAKLSTEDSIIRDGEGNALYLNDQIIIKFHPDLVDTSIVNNTSIQTGIVSDFINPIALQMIIDSGFFNQGLADLSIKKIHHKLTTYDTISVTRIGDTIRIPKYWSTFLIFWNDTVGMSFLNAIDTFNKMWPVIEYARLNHIGELLSLPNDAYFLSGDQAGLHPTVLIPDGNININPAWDQSVGRDIIKVGVFDNGINWDHEDFSEDNSGNWNKSRIKGGWDYKNNVHVSNSTTVDLDGHGTAIAGIIGAIRNNDRGVAGIGGGNGALNQWGVELYDLKIAENNAYVKESDIANAVTEGSSSFNGNFGYSLNVQNHSWRAFSLGEATKEAFRFSYRNSVVIAAASGNFGGAFDELFPASFNDKWILKVGANDENGVRLSTSSYGFSLDFLAPGTANLYAAPDANSNTTYNTYNQPGTSFSTPHAAGLASLMLSNINAPSSAPNNLAPEDVDTLIKKFANDVLATGVGWDNETGYGIINAGATLQGIQLPRFEIRHYNSTFNNNLASKISSNISFVLNETTEGVKAGTYNGDVYEITRNFNISQPTGRTILDVWTRNSNSTLFASHPIVPEVNCSLTSWNQSTATMKGYIYYLNTNSTGQKINKWFPSSATGLNGTGKMAITVYSDDPLSNGNQNGTPMDKLFNIHQTHLKEYFLYNSI